MANPAIVVILVAAADAHDPSTVALTRAAREALGPDAVVAVHEVETVPGPADAAAIGAKLHADAVASVTWTLADRRRAHIRVVITTDGHALDRDLDFSPGDADAERGRTIGLTIVALIPESQPPAPVPPPPPPPPPAAAPRAMKRPDVVVVAVPRFGLEAFAVTTSGPFGIGGGLAGRYLPFPSPRIGASLRAGTVADTTLRTIDLTVGIAPQLLDALGARLEVGATQQSVTLRGEEHSRFVAHARVFGEGVWWTTASVGVGLAAGLELAFGETRVLVGDSPIGSIPRARFIFELSLRARK
jgi:hypothetical protein